MVVHAERRFAERVATWMMARSLAGTLNARQMTDRLYTCFHDGFIDMVIEESDRLAEE